MKNLPDIRAFRAIFTSLLMSLLVFGLALPVQASTFSTGDMMNAVATDDSVTKSPVRSHQAMNMDCCEDQSCPDDMDCSNECLSHCFAASVFLASQNYVIPPIGEGSVRVQNTNLTNLTIAINAPPPRV